MLSFVLAITTLALVIPTTIYVSIKKDLCNFDWYIAAMLWTYMAYDGIRAIGVLAKGLPN